MENQSKWILDPTHSEILFKVRHLMITNVKGEFRTFDSSFTTNEENFNQSNVIVNIDVNSIFTNNNDRDQHLKSQDFFDVENFNSIKFEGNSLTKIEGNHYTLKGILTMKGISKEISLDAEFGGFMKDPWGNTKAGFTVSGKINRKDWGLNWNAALETGGLMVSEEVHINTEVQYVKQ